MKLAIKYCGSCNPHIDLPRIGRDVVSLAKILGFTLVSPQEEGVDNLLVLNGCLRACGNREEVTSRAARSIIVAGESLQGEFIAEKSLPLALRGHLSRAPLKNGVFQG